MYRLAHNANDIRGTDSYMYSLSDVCCVQVHGEPI